MAETGIDPTEGADDEGTVDETSHQTGELALQVNDSVAELPADYYVTLQSLTLDLVATQLERTGIKFTREPDRIAANWPTSDLVVRILPDDVLSVRATLRQEYPANGITALTGVCNSWNNSRLFLKASTTVGMSQTEPDDEDGEREPWPVARLCLDLDVPLPVGVAPVQLQSLLREAARNVATFEGLARLDDLIPRPAW